ncbi:MAG: hypothetical protein HXY50_01480 [Ignavibacteriaceae bacterium]|nr:hypothetical protein [Ignavibacteriaceae bacterium]
MKQILVLLTACFLAVNIYSQSNVNPDISLIGTFNTFTNNVKETPEYGKLNFETPSMELYVDGYLNPYSRATANIAFEEGEFHLEEMYAQILRGLPLDMQIKAGKYLVGFGKINTIHPHAWQFIQRPLFHQVFFGDEGFNDIGATFSFILPTETFYSNLDLGILKGDGLRSTHSHEHESETESDHINLNSPIFISRLSAFFDLDDYTNLEIGLNSSYGAHSKMNFNTLGDSSAEPTVKTLNYLYGGIDFKLKYKPNSYTALTIQGEGLMNSRDVFRQGDIGVNIPIEKSEKINTFGAFILVDYFFSKQFSIGAKYDFTFGIVGDEREFNTSSNDDKNKTHGISGWLGYYPIEETLALRLGVQNLSFKCDDRTQRDSETTVTLQMLFSLGPHKAHPF